MVSNVKDCLTEPSQRFRNPQVPDRAPASSCTGANLAKKNVPMFVNGLQLMTSTASMTSTAISAAALSTRVVAKQSYMGFHSLFTFHPRRQNAFTIRLITAERTLTTVCCNGLHKSNEVLFTLTTETDPEGVLLSCALAESISVGPQFASLLKTVTSPSLSTMREQLPTLLDVRGESGEALMRSFTFPSCPLRM